MLKLAQIVLKNFSNKEVAISSCILTISQFKDATAVTHMSQLPIKNITLVFSRHASMVLLLQALTKNASMRLIFINIMLLERSTILQN
jgi:hypothetical protein